MLSCDIFEYRLFHRIYGYVDTTLNIKISNLGLKKLR